MFSPPFLAMGFSDGQVSREYPSHAGAKEAAKEAHQIEELTPGGAERRD